MFLAQLGINPAKIFQILSLHMPISNVCLLILLLLSGDTSLNLGPINFGFVNCSSVRNKNPLIGDTIVLNNLYILALTETNKQTSDIDSLYTEVFNSTWLLTHS